MEGSGGEPPAPRWFGVTSSRGCSVEVRAARHGGNIRIHPRPRPLRARGGSTIAVCIWGVITVIGVAIVLRSLRAGHYEMAYIAALFAANDGASVPTAAAERENPSAYDAQAMDAFGFPAAGVYADIPVDRRGVGRAGGGVGGGGGGTALRGAGSSRTLGHSRNQTPPPTPRGRRC